MTELGRLVAAGRTSDVYEFGLGSVVKVPRRGVPAHWAAIEAEITAAVHAQGLPTPEVRGIERIEGRDSVVFERIDGPSLWEQIRDGQGGVSALAVRLGEIQLAIHAQAAPASLLALGDRVCQKIESVDLLTTPEHQDAARIVQGLPAGSVLCHGDLHPGNILMSDRGPIVIDWFDAAVGSPIADIVRSSLLIRPVAEAEAHAHLPGSSFDLLERVHDDYLACVLGGRVIEPSVVRGWEAVLAASRLAERAEADESRLLALWRGRRGEAPSPLIEAISAVAGVGDEAADGAVE